jgi:thioredoxin-dependent peroxiredoxin
MYERIHVAVDSVMPDFTLKDEFGKNLSLKKFKRDKKYVVLAIIRGVDDAHTRQQLDYLRNDYQRFHFFGGDVLAVSYGSVDFNRSLITNLSLPFHILSDTKYKLIEQLGLRNQYEILVGPAIYLLNQAGTVLFMYQGKEPEDIVEDEEIIMAMRGDTQSGPDWPVRW